MEKPYGCFFPLNAIALHPQGAQKFCLTSTAPAQADTSEFNQQRLEVHSQLSQGLWPETCRSCLRQENLGLQSRRMKTWQRKALMYGETKLNSIAHEQTQPKLRHLEISFSNVCNLQCAMCSSEFSSSWIADDKGAVQSGLEFRNFTEKFQNVRRVSPETLDGLLQHADEIDLLIIKGGEPTRDPLCLDFLNQLARKRSQSAPSIFLQTNGTRHPSEWLPALEGLRLEVGFSIDGWGEDYEWIRGTSFDRVMEHLHYLDDQPQIETLGIDFTLSVFNCFHFPQFLEQVLLLKGKLKKLDNCSFFQWAQEAYARPDSIKLECREQVAEEARVLIERNPGLFLNSENILKVLTLKQGDESQRNKALRWIDYMNGLRGKSLYELQPALRAAL